MQTWSDDAAYKVGTSNPFFGYDENKPLFITASVDTFTSTGVNFNDSWKQDWTETAPTQSVMEIESAPRGEILTDYPLLAQYIKMIRQGDQ